MPSTRFLIVCLLAVPAATQLPVAITGRVERVAGSPCNAAATHTLACTGILLHSSTVDLTTWEGRMADLEGVADGTLTCPSVDVAAAVAAPHSTTTFSLGGYRLGSTVVFTTTAPAGAAVAYFFASEPGFLPFLGFGTLQLDLTANFIYWGVDVSIGVALRSVRIPNEVGLVGQLALFQTAFIAVTPTLQLKLLNDGCFTIR
jgi:hypothetical protein